MSKSVHAFTTQSELLEALSQKIAGNLKTAIRHHGYATMLVSGGSTPKPLFEVLRRIDLPWEKVSIGLCDERWVPPTHSDSNERYVKKYLLQERAGKARFVGMYTEDLSWHEAQGHCSQTYQEELYPFDVILLGMGNDGHTASLFPQSRQLDQALDLANKKLCIAIEPKTAPHRRMSLTRAAILSARHLYLHFEGQEKLAVYEEAIKGDDIQTLPVRAVLQQDLTDIKVYFR